MYYGPLIIQIWPKYPCLLYMSNSFHPIFNKLGESLLIVSKLFLKGVFCDSLPLLLTDAFIFNTVDEKVRRCPRWKRNETWTISSRFNTPQSVRTPQSTTVFALITEWYGGSEPDEYEDQHQP